MIERRLRVKNIKTATNRIQAHSQRVRLRSIGGKNCPSRTSLCNCIYLLEATGNVICTDSDNSPVIFQPALAFNITNKLPCSLRLWWTWWKWQKQRNSCTVVVMPQKLRQSKGYETSADNYRLNLDARLNSVTLECWQMRPVFGVVSQLLRGVGFRQHVCNDEIFNLRVGKNPSSKRKKEAFRKRTYVKHDMLRFHNPLIQRQQRFCRLQKSCFVYKSSVSHRCIKFLSMLIPLNLALR